MNRIRRTFVLVALLLVSANSFASEPLTLRADWFDRGNLIPASEYSDGPLCVIHHGRGEPDSAEYDVEFPADGKYAVSALYAAAESRPIDVLFDGVLVAPQVCAATTGSWRTKTAEWETVTTIDVTAGKHTLTLFRKQCIPHICAIRFEPLFDFDGASWKLPRETAQTRLMSAPETDDISSLPWPVDWFAEVSFDRRKKQESGGVFTDHFAGESAVALLPIGSYTLEAGPVPKPVDPTFVLNDELTYRRMKFTEETDTDVIRPEIVVRVTLNEAQKAADGPVIDGTSFVVSTERYALLLDKTLGLMDAFTERFGEDELADAGIKPERLNEIKTRCESRRKRIDEKTAEIIEALKANTPNESLSKFADEFFETVRDFSFLTRSNPLLDFDELIYVERKTSDLGLMQNWMSNSTLNPDGFDDKLISLKLRGAADNADHPIPQSRLLFKPNYPTFLGDLDLHFDADRLLISSIQRDKAWNLFELNLEKIGELSTEEATSKTDELFTPQIPPLPEANHYDGCYLADGSIVYTSSACYAAVPCVNGYTRITNTFRKYADGNIRRLTFDQEHNWCPTVMPDGRILYLRWEYTDAPHVPARLLFLMNPDGTNQRSFYGSNSYWPNSMFYARPIPDDGSKFIAIVSGHHGVTRMGELVLFDTHRGRKETSGAVMRICGKEKQVASKTDPKYDDTLIVDNLVDEAWPKFLHPYPLSENYFLVSAQPKKDDLWGIYLVDTEDNMTLLTQNARFACFEPTPLRKTEKPPVPSDRINVKKSDATVYIADLYEGPGLKGVPRGTVKSLRLISYNYLFPNMGGPQGTVGMEGPWDIKRIVGTVPVEESGAALFHVPANLPFAIEPLDENGRAVQLMRSWMTAMPGETLACVGCHEDENRTSPVGLNSEQTAKLVTREIKPWYGKARGFAFTREVQPVLDRYCVGCHDGTHTSPGNAENKVADLRGLERITDYTSVFHHGTKSGRFSTSYTELHCYVRRPGMESDYHLLMPTEFSAETTDLYQLLAKGHYGVKLDDESWDRMVTWIDLNAPYYGTWGEQAETDDVAHWNERRRTVKELYSGVTDDEEKIEETVYNPNPTLPDAAALTENLAAVPMPNLPAWSFGAEEAKTRQKRAAAELFGDENAIEKRVELAEGVYLTLTLIPAGDFVAGSQSPDANGTLLIRSPDESPHAEKIEKPFWLATLETTNRQFELFDPSHDSGVESRYAMQFGVRGFYVNAPERPVVRVSWNEAQAFCRWLSDRTGMTFRLPSAAEAEWASRAGTATPFWYGSLNTDFAKCENLCDATTRDFVCHPYFKEVKPLGGSKYDQWLPKDERFCDGALLTTEPGSYLPNPWGLFDTLGNVSEWTSDDADGGKVVKGGSWRDRPIGARAESRTVYRPWQGVYDVGFRLAAEVKN